MSPDDTLLPTIKEIEDEQLKLKMRQPTGSDTPMTYKITTGATWDVDHTFVFSGGQTEAFGQLLMRYTADNQNAPFCDLRLVVLINNSDYYIVSRWEQGTNGIWMNPIAPDNYGNYSPDYLPNDPNQVCWYSAAKAFSSGTNVKIRIEVYSTDTGVIDFRFDT